LYTKEERGKKNAMKRSYIGKETLMIHEKSSFELKYYVLEEVVENESNQYVEYGVEIEKQDSSRIEKSQIKDITTDQTRIDIIVKSLIRNSVTPVHLHDVIEDML